MKPRHPIVCLDCAATAHAQHRRATERRVALITVTALVIIAALAAFAR